MKLNNYNIGIIGAGAVGVSVLNELINKLIEIPNTNQYNITIYEKTGAFGRGLAYSTKIDGHILNMPANTMSAKYDQQDQFIFWLRNFSTCCPFAIGKDFIPRSIFGDYLQVLLETSIERARKKGIEVHLISEGVTKVEEKDNFMWVESNTGTSPYNQLILCLGNQSSNIGREFKSIPGYFHQPWPEHKIMSDIPNTRDVNILGASLSAVDTLLTLLENGHKGKIRFISRTGILPKVRSYHKPYNLKHFTTENIQLIRNNLDRKLSLDEVKNLFFKELQYAGVEIQEIIAENNTELNSQSEILKNNIKRAKEDSVNYFPVLKAIDDISGVIWNNISFEAKKEFDQKYRTLWNMYDYPTPLQNAYKILKAIEDKQLSIYSGIKDIKYNAIKECFEIECIDEKNNPTSLISKYLINSTGGGFDITKMDNPIIQRSLELGLFYPHPLGGIDVDFETGLIKKRDGKLYDNLYAIGSLTRGVHFYTNSLYENSKASKNSANKIINSILNTVSCELEKEDKQYVVS